MDARLRKERDKMNTISSLLNFIGNKISDLQTPAYEAINVAPQNEKVAGGYAFIVFDKVSNLVRINFYVNAKTNVTIGSNETIFTIPQAYRPSSQRSGSCISVSQSGSIGSAQCRVLPDGSVRQTVSNVATRIFGVIEYKMGGE